MNGDDVALKIEHKIRHTLMQLPHEQRIYQILRGSTSLGHFVGFPQMLFYGESPTMNIGTFHSKITRTRELLYFYET